VQKLLDIKAYDIAVIKPRELPNGVTYIGTINKLGLDIYTYNEWYLDNWTDPENPEQKPLVPEKTLALMSTAAEYSICYGAVTILDSTTDNFVTIEGQIIPESWVERRPSRRFLQLNSQPLPVPHEVDSWFVAKVL
jgi:Phage major capsid protein E.